MQKVYLFNNALHILLLLEVAHCRKCYSNGRKLFAMFHYLNNKHLYSYHCFKRVLKVLFGGKRLSRLFVSCICIT